VIFNDCQQPILIRLRQTGGAEAVPEMRQQLAPALASAGHVVLDLRGVVPDTSVLGVVFSLQRRLELKGRVLVVVARQRNFYRLLEVLGVDASLIVFRDVDAAAAYARARPLLELAA
jgi:anti-anti-sigma regulatory factor